MSLISYVVYMPKKKLTIENESNKININVDEAWSFSNVNSMHNPFQILTPLQQKTMHDLMTLKSLQQNYQYKSLVSTCHVISIYIECVYLENVFNDTLLFHFPRLKNMGWYFFLSKKWPIFPLILQEFSLTRFLVGIFAKESIS